MSDSESSYFIYDLIRNFWLAILNIFFREIASGNAHSIPKDGPVIFVIAPHNNQFVDPLLVLKHSPRRVYFLVAASSLKKRIVGFYGRLLRGIPVERAIDHKTKGKGRIFLKNHQDEPNLITGVGTIFTSEFVIGDRIFVKGGVGQSKVDKVISDTELIIKDEIKAPEALEVLTSEQGAAYDKVPALDQHTVYNAVYERLNQNECIGIFPEGGSHDQSKMLPLKIGVTLMALGATVNNPDLKINIVPTGLNYFHPSKFRSRAVVEFGNPIPIEPELVEKFKQGGQAKREACSTLLETISEALKSVTLNTPDHDTLHLINTCRRLYDTGHGTISMRHQVELSRRFVKGYMELKDNPEVAQVIQQVAHYKKDLEYFGLRDHQVEKLRMSRSDAVLTLLWRTFWLIFSGTIALSGSILNTPVFVITRIISRIKAKEALAASTVKLKANDVIATWKILVALVFVPALYFIYSVIFVIYSRHSSFSSLRLFAQNTNVFVLFMMGLILVPLISLISLNFGEHAVDIFKSLTPIYMVILDNDGMSKKLINERSQLSKNITTMVNDIGTQLYPELLKMRTIIDSEQEEEDSATDGLRHRGSVGSASDSTLLGGSLKSNLPSLTPKFLSKISAVSPFDFLGTGTRSRSRSSRKSRSKRSSNSKTKASPELVDEETHLTGIGRWLASLYPKINIFSVDLTGENYEADKQEFFQDPSGISDNSFEDGYDSASSGFASSSAAASRSHSRTNSSDSINSLNSSASNYNSNKTVGMSPLTPANADSEATKKD